MRHRAELRSDSNIGRATARRGAGPVCSVAPSLRCLRPTRPPSTPPTTCPRARTLYIPSKKHLASSETGRKHVGRSSRRRLEAVRSGKPCPLSIRIWWLGDCGEQDSKFGHQLSLSRLAAPHHPPPLGDGHLASAPLPRQPRLLPTFASTRASLAMMSFPSPQARRHDVSRVYSSVCSLTNARIPTGQSRRAALRAE